MSVWRAPGVLGVQPRGLSSPDFVPDWVFQASSSTSLPSVFLGCPVGIMALPWPASGSLWSQ